MLKHIITAKTLGTDDLEMLFDLAEDIRERPNTYAQCLKGKVLGTFFKEPSTRTRLSFETAMCRLGGTYVSVENAENSSQAKGESLRDTLLTMSQLVDIIVVRLGDPDNLENSLGCAYHGSRVPVISGGEGRLHHPTQAMLDLYTIWRKYKKIDGLRVLLVGDPHNSRTVSSLLHLLNKYDVQVTAALHYPSAGVGLREHFSEIKFIPENDIQMQLPETDVLYMTRFQDERAKLDENWRAKPTCFILYRRQADMMPQDAMILHPFPRRSELPLEIDENHRAAYVQQMENGMWLRMALMLDCLGMAGCCRRQLSTIHPGEFVDGSAIPWPQEAVVNVKPGYPQSDEFSIQAGCCYNDRPCDCSANLDIFYNCQFVQNEVVDNVTSVQCEPGKIGHQSKYKYRYGPLAHAPIIPGTVTGCVDFGDVHVVKFCQSSSGVVTITEVPPKDNWEDRTISVKEINLNFDTGEFAVSYAGCPPLDHKLVVSYEYNPDHTRPS